VEQRLVAHHIEIGRSCLQQHALLGVVEVGALGLHDELGLVGNYVEFQPGLLWIPYTGEKPITLTAD